jgi:(p)ppGpp synthase/HD superfamily hydrolase
MNAEFGSVFRNAVRFMISSHGNQDRKREINGVAMPYFTHPLDVMQLVWKWGAGSPRNILASIGHDLIEDCNLTEEEVVAGFTMSGLDGGLRPYIAEAGKIITELSFLPPKIDKILEKWVKENHPQTFDQKRQEEEKRLKDEEKRLKDEYLRTFDKKSIDAFIIKLADRFCNSMDYKLNDPRYAFKYFKKAQFLFDTLSKRCEEIEAAFGERTYDNICSTYQAVLVQLSEDKSYGIAMP